MTGKKGMVKKYAGALYNIAVQQEDVKEVSKRLKFISAVLKAVPELNQLLITRRVSSKNKFAILNKVLEGRISVLEKDLIFHLLEDGHFLLFNEIVKRFDYLVETDSNVVKVRITSPQVLPEEEIQKISSRVENQLNKKVAIYTETDPALLGGIKLRIGNTLIDSSVSNRLMKLRNTLVRV